VSVFFIFFNAFVRFFLIFFDFFIFFEGVYADLIARVEWGNPDKSGDESGCEPRRVGM